jgi:hypothetical protein
MELKVPVSLSFRNFLVPTNQKSGSFNPAQKFNLFLSIFRMVIIGVKYMYNMDLYTYT